MEAVFTTQWMPRDGSQMGDYEDAFAPATAGKMAGRRLRFAVADGATESLLSGPWARLLVDTWVSAPRRSAGQLVGAARLEWDRQLAAYLGARASSDRPVQWYEEPGLARGAHATFVGFQLTSRRVVGASGKWSAVAAGDSCMFHLRGDGVIGAFPIEEASAFDRTPDLLASREPGPEPRSGPRRKVRLEARFGEWRSGDVFLLATDAFARWFLSCLHDGVPACELTRVTAYDRDEFARWVAARRSDRSLANDDVTVVSVECL